MAVYNYLFVIIFLVVAAALAVKAGKLTPGGGTAGAIVGLLVFAGGRYIGLGMLSAFFILGTLATSWKKNEKSPFKAITDRSAKRNAWQVLANGGVAAAMALLAFLFHHYADIFRLMMAAALSAATADTLSSELGMVYGRRFFNIVTFKKEAKGLDGVISIEGLLIGMLGSAVIAAIVMRSHVGHPWFMMIVLTGTIGNLADSFLGALFERKKYIGNDTVNFLNTLVAALAMLVWIVLTR